MILEAALFGDPPHANTTMMLINPFAFLWTAFKAGGSFHGLVSAALTASPCSPDRPWRLCLYSDEISFGNQLAVVNVRKAWAMYFSFLEFGLHLHNENAWAPLAAEPSQKLKHVNAGISQVFKVVLREFSVPGITT